MKRQQPHSSLTVDEWEDRFAGSLAGSSRSGRNSLPAGHIHVIDDAPPQRDSVRSEHGSYHGLLLATGYVENAKDRLEGGDVHFDTIRPGDLHIYSLARNEQPHRSRWHSPLSFVSVMLRPTAVADACRAAGLDYDATTFADAFFADDPLLTQLIRQLSTELRGPTAAPLYTDQLLHTMAAHLVRYYTHEPVNTQQSPGGLPPTRLRRVKDYIDAHLDQDLSLDTLASVACYSTSHFSHAFKESTGQSPYQYVIRRRMDEALHQLQSHPHRRISTVGRNVGYSSPSHFSRQFKAYHGVPPSRCQS
jgi:AraC family transcriptional regulator